MNEPRAPRTAPRLANPRRFLVLAVVVVIISLVLLFWARPLIRELIILPLSYLFWALGVFFENTSQRFFWTALLIISALAAFRSLVRRSKEYTGPPLESVESQYDRPFRGQVSLWRLKINTLRGTESSYVHSSFEQSVGKLLFDALAHRHHLSANEVEERLRADALDVPPAVREYALRSLRRVDSAPKSDWAQIWQEIVMEVRGWFFRGREEAIPPNPRLKEDIERLQVVLAYLEKDLEVDHDDRGQ